MQTTVAIIPERLAKITTLAQGAHDAADGEMCVMEAEAYVVGGPWSDAHDCVCPVIGAFMRSWNDSLPQADRDRLLLPFVGRLAGSRSTKEVEHRRSLMAADWLVRTHTPAWLRLAGLTTQADALANLPEITSMAHVSSIRCPLEAARIDASSARDAARAAARDAAASAAAARDAAASAAAARDAAASAAAARDAAWEAASAAWEAASAAWEAASAAMDDAWVAAWDARDAARDAAWAAALVSSAATAAWTKLRPTVEHLQTSSVALIERMLAA